MEWINEIIPENYLYAIGWMLVHSIWQIAGLGLVLWLSLGFLHKKSAELKYRLGVITLLLLVFSSISTEIFYFEPTHESTANQAIFIPENDIVYLPTDFEVPKTSETTFEILSKQIERRIPILVNIWLIGAILFMIKFGGALAEIRNLSLKPKKTIEGSWQTALIDFSQKLKVKQTVKLFLSKFVYSPVTYGVFKPVILIPAGLIFQLSPSQIEAIIAHELAHIKRYDYLVNLIQSAMEVIFFFHPAFWYINSIIKTEREHACDDAAIQVGIRARDLAEALVVIVNHAKQSQPQLALAAAKSKTPTLDRIKRIMGFHTSHKQTSTLTRFTMMLTLILSASLILGAQTDKSNDFNSDPTLTKIHSEFNLADDFWLNFPQDENAGKNIEKEIANDLKHNLGTPLKELSESLGFISKAFSAFSNNAEKPKSYDFKVSLSEDGKPFSIEDISKDMKSDLLSRFDNHKFYGDTLHVWSNLKTDSDKSYIKSISDNLNSNGSVSHTMKITPLEFQGGDFSAMPLLTLSEKMTIPHIHLDSIKKLNSKQISQVTIKEYKADSVLLKKLLENPSFKLANDSYEKSDSKHFITFLEPFKNAKFDPLKNITPGFKFNLNVDSLMIKKELELAKIKASEFAQKQTLGLAKVQSAPRIGSNINSHQKDSLDLTKQLRVAVEKLKSATNEKEKAEAVKKISEIANYLDDYNIGRVQPPMEVDSEAYNRLLLGQTYSTSPNYSESRKLTEAEQKEKKKLEETYKTEFDKYQKEFGSFMKEYQQKLETWQKEQEPLLKAYQEKMAKLEEEAKPLMEEYQQKMNTWMKENEGRFKFYQEKMSSLQKEYAIKIQELQKEIQENKKSEKN
ncbi:M56 family metallopeptidase [Belliella aquatica]|uniref:Peptidase M56 domain-containing protein n=1 Tax=Belliella aquatica TaxID=1323734 RepID=A0ABQ1MQ71_9BACT|nr:M56 family metallopeptidase [Belliella aquatica]MCH7405307.1 M56 family metallopeptidase [Belliella aquatica]GGC42696.1 hypothetical protein GCM10010993_21590 [Belliella aquatica]